MAKVSGESPSVSAPKPDPKKIGAEAPHTKQAPTEPLGPDIRAEKESYLKNDTSDHGLRHELRHASGHHRSRMENLTMKWARLWRVADNRQKAFFQGGQRSETMARSEPQERARQVFQKESPESQVMRGMAEMGESTAAGGKWKTGSAQELTPFEKFFLTRGDKQGGQKSESWSGEGILGKGQFRFGKKSEAEGNALENKFLPFRQAKTVSGDKLDGLIFRWVLKNPPLSEGMRPGMKEPPKSNMPALIGDLRLANGKTEKFARVPFEALTNSQLVARVLATISTLLPGDLIAKILLSRWFGGGELSYQALSRQVQSPELAQSLRSALTESAAARSESGIVYGKEAQKGVLLSARTEQALAEQLNLRVRSANQEGIFADPRASQQGGFEKGGIFGFRRRRRGSSEEPLYIPGWVPWYQLVWQPRKWKGKVKWYIPLLYLIAISTVFFGTIYLFRYILPNY